MDLSKYDSSKFDRGASRFKEAAWSILSAILVAGPIPGSRWRAIILRAFGARIAKGVVLKPRVLVKFPWRLEIGAYSWIGENVWIDNLADVRIGRNACISQGVYIGTGNHDWNRSTFDLMTAPIAIGDQCWVGAYAIVAPGTQMGTGAVLGMGTVAAGHLADWTIYGHNRATPVGKRCDVSARSSSE